MNYLTCPHCGESYPEFDAAHVCSRGPYAVKLQSDTNTNTKERIRELAQQAGIKYGVRDDVYYSKSFDGVYRLDMEKFAELIVRECIKESLNEIVSGDEIAQEKDPLNKEYLKGNNQGIVDAVVRFRNHFGVEE